MFNKRKTEKDFDLFDRIFCLLLERDHRKPQNLSEEEIMVLCDKAKYLTDIIKIYKYKNFEGVN